MTVVIKRICSVMLCRIQDGRPSNNNNSWSDDCNDNVVGYDKDGGPQSCPWVGLTYGLGRVGSSN